MRILKFASIILLIVSLTNCKDKEQEVDVVGENRNKTGTDNSGIRFF